MAGKFKCHKISPGAVEGKILISRDPILFYQTDPATGVIIERGHDLEGVSVSGRIIVFPGGKGSSVVQADGLYKLEQKGTAPLGLIVKKLDTVLVSSAVIMEIPMVSAAEDGFYRAIKNDDLIRLDATREVIEIL